jgi:hypothetical protein
MLAPSSTTLHAQLSQFDTASALGIVATGSSPILLLCRKLVAAGYDPATPMDCWRGDTLCLSVRSIGQAASLEINAHGTGFIPHRARRAGPVVDWPCHNDPNNMKTRPAAMPDGFLTLTEGAHPTQVDRV